MNRNELAYDGIRPLSHAEGVISPVRLLWLENRDEEISRIVHALTAERTRNREEATKIRMAFTPQHREDYEAMKRAPSLLQKLRP